MDIVNRLQGKRPKSVHGGPRIRRAPWPRRQLFGAEEKAAVEALMEMELREGGALVYAGKQTKAYCDEFAAFLGGGYAHAVNSGTNAVYVALRSLDLEPFTEVIVPPITDPGGCMPVPLLNCIPIPADSTPGSLNVGPQQIEACITDRTSAIVLAHISGEPVDLDPIVKMARERNILIVEDCAQAHGALYRGCPVGTLGDVAAFSTMFGKHHATGAQGGVVFTRNRHTSLRVQHTLDRGKPQGVDNAPGNLVCSLNFNQDELSSAIGRCQLRKLPSFIQNRRDFVAELARHCGDLQAIRLKTDPPDCEGVYWFALLSIDTEELGCPKDQFVLSLAKEGIVGARMAYNSIPSSAPWFSRPGGIRHEWISLVGSAVQGRSATRVRIAERARSYRGTHYFPASRRSGPAGGSRFRGRLEKGRALLLRAEVAAFPGESLSMRPCEAAAQGFPDPFLNA